MRFFTKSLAAVFFSFLLLPGLVNKSKACDRSDMVLDSLVDNGNGTYGIFVTVCMGGGVLGNDFGANGPTRTFGFGFFSASQTIAVSSFPASFSSDSTGTTYNALPFGPGFQGSDEFIAYLDNGTDLMCINSNPPCGLPHSQCWNVSFTVNGIPDSLRLYGIEGANSALGGCYPNIDMVIDFSTLPVVWGGASATPRKDGIELDWSTLQEINNDHFIIERSSDGINFNPLMQQEGMGNTQTPTQYQILDRNPSPGLNYYRIVQVDYDGATDASNVVSAVYEAPLGMTWESVIPVPSEDFVSLTWLSDQREAVTLEVYDLHGRMVHQTELEALTGSNQLRLDIRDYRAGIYFVRLSSTHGILERKILKQ